MALPVRRQYKGAAASTTTTLNIAPADTSVTIASNAGWPAGADPFYVVLSPGGSAEEKCLATISGTNLTLTRAQDDTTAQTHPSGSTIYPVFTAVDANEANAIASKMTTKGDILTTSGTDINRLGVGTNTHVLQADSTATNGIKWGQVATAGIADAAITTAKIATGAVVADDLATDSVTTVKIADSNVTTAKINDGAVTAAKLAADAAIQPTIVDAKGDLIAGTAADTVARLAVGTNGQYLKADSTQTTGLAWGTITQAVSSVTTAEVATSQTYTSASYGDLTTSGPAVTVTTGTSVLVAITATVSNGTSQNVSLVSVAVSGSTTTAAADANALYNTSDVASGTRQMTVLIPLTVTAGSNTFTLKYRVGGGTTGTFANRRITVIAL
jgi:hypothetical protein